MCTEVECEQVQCDREEPHTRTLRTGISCELHACGERSAPHRRRPRPGRGLSERGVPKTLSPTHADGRHRECPAWLYRTATNLGIDALRASARRYRYEKAAARTEIKESFAESALDQSLRLETQERVRAVLAELQPVQAQLLLLRMSGHSYKELAEMLDLEIGTIGTRLVRAEAAFEERYVELYGREEKL